MSSTSSRKGNYLEAYFKIVNYLNSIVIPRQYILIIKVLSIFVIGLIDYLITIDISLSICYLIPIFFATRYLDKNTGILLSFLSAISWGIAESEAKADLNMMLLLWNTVVRLSVFVIVVHLLSALKNAYEREKNLARIDGLTRIYNRRYFLDILSKERKRAIRYQRCLTLVYFDVDNFKQVNDRFGHARGDKLLYLISRTVSHNIRDTDVFARLGGDEFALLLPETNYQAAQLVIKRIRDRLTQAVEEKTYDVGFSMGAVTFLDLPNSIDNMLERVDRLMYQVKNTSKNDLQHQLYDLSLN